jgi:tetratricopeptide (TPR) repeat protein
MDPATRALLENADTLYREGRFDEAAAVCLDALELAPGSPRILKQLGNIALWNNRSGEAEQYYQKALLNELRPAGLDERGLVAALTDYLTTFEQQQSIRVD